MTSIFFILSGATIRLTIIALPPTKNMNIMNIVAEHYNISVQDIISTKRDKSRVYPRQIVMYLCRNHTDKSLKEIGNLLGNRDHSTIMHGCSKIEEDLANNVNNIQTTIETLMKKINPN